MNELDQSVLEMSCVLIMNTSSMDMIQSGRVIEHFEQQGYNKNDVVKSLKYLYENGYVSSQDMRVLHYQVTWFGFEEYARREFDDYDEVEMRILCKIVESKGGTSSQIAHELDIPHAFVNHIIDGCALRGLLQTQKHFGGVARVHGITETLERIVQSDKRT